MIYPSAERPWEAENSILATPPTQYTPVCFRIERLKPKFFPCSLEFPYV